MNATRDSLRYLAVPLAASVFVLLSSRELPPVVASHFDGSGAANGFMSRDFYTWFMLAFVVGLPLLLAYLPAFAFRRPAARINLPNATYWLAPERRQETIDFICRHLARFGILLVLLLCYSHWLVIEANLQVPPKLSSPRFNGGLLLFVTLSLVWAGILLGRFFRVPREDA